MDDSTPQGTGAERRRHRRHRISLDARLRTVLDDKIPCIIHDFSSRGMRLGVSTRLVSAPRIVLPGEGERIDLYFALPQGAKVRAQSKVIRLSRQGGVELLGVGFASCNPVVLDRLLSLAREQEAQERSGAPAELDDPRDTLIRAVYDGLLERAMGDGAQGAYFYSLMALKGREDQLRAQLGRVLAGEPGPPFAFDRLPRAFRAVFGQLERADAMQKAIEGLLAEIAEEGRSDLVAR